ncbi:MAG: hypothetical protein ACYC5N_03545, partial [Endomicrobiales bacterium]
MLNNGTIPVPAGTIETTLNDPSGNCVHRSSMSFEGMLPGETRELPANVISPPGLLGNYTFNYDFRFKGRTYGKIELPCAVFSELLFDRPVYKVNEPLNGTVKLSNTGKFDISGSSFTVTIPDAGFDETYTVSLATGEVREIPFSALLPATMTGGQHAVNACLRLKSGSTKTSTSTIYLPELFEFSLDPENCYAGETGTITIRNTGCVNVRYAYMLAIKDTAGTACLALSGTGFLETGKENFIAFTVPKLLEKGIYTVSLECNDTATGKSFSFNKVIVVQSGISTMLSVRTGQETYNPGDSIDCSAAVTSDTLLPGSEVRLRVRDALQGLNNYLHNGQINDVASDGKYSWFASQSGGILRFDPATGSWSQFTKENTNGALPGNCVKNIYVWDRFIGFVSEIPQEYSYGGPHYEFCRYDRANGSFLNVTNGRGAGRYATDSGNLWWFAEKKLYGYDASNDSFSEKNLSYVTPDGNLDNFLLDGENILLLTSFNSWRSGTVGYTLRQYNIRSDSCDLTISCPSWGDIVVDSATVWIAGKSGENPLISGYDRATGQWTSVLDTSTVAGSVPMNPVNGGDCIWWTGSSGLYRFDKASLTNTLILPVASEIKALKKLENYLCAVQRDRGGYLFNTLTGDMTQYPGLLCAETGGGRLWIGTENEGVYSLNPANGDCDRLTTDSGLMSNSVPRIKPDGNMVWFMYPENGASSYDYNDSWENYLEEIGNSNTEAIQVSEDEVFIAHHFWFTGYPENEKISILDKATGKAAVKSGFGTNTICGDRDYVWSTFIVPYSSNFPHKAIVKYDRSNDRVYEISSGTGSLVSSNIVLAGGYAWTIELTIDDPEGLPEAYLCRYNRATDERTAFILPFTADQISGFSLVAEGNSLYINRTSRILRFDTVTNRFQWIDMPRYDAFYTYKAEKISADARYLWVLTSQSASFFRYDRITGNWDRIGFPSASDLKYSECLASGPTDIWIGKENSIYRYNKQNGSWSSYEVSDGTVSAKVKCMDVDDSSVWIGTDKGLWRYAYRGKVLWDKAIPVNTGGTFELSATIPPLKSCGKFYLQGNVKANPEQELCSAATAFYVLPGNTLLKLYADRSCYKAGEQVAVHCELRNGGLQDEEGTLLVKKNGTPLFTFPVILAPNSSRTFEISTIADETFHLEASFNGTTVNDIVEVEKSIVNMAISGPDVAGPEPFEASVLLHNTGRIGASFAVDFSGETSTMTLSPGELRIMQKTFTVSADTTITVALSGDVNSTLQKKVLFGYKGYLTVMSEAAYPEGPVEVPFTITNTGALDLNVDIDFFINEKTIRSYVIPSGGGLFDTLVIDDLKQGTYVLGYRSEYFSGTRLIQVKGTNIVEIRDLAVYPSSSGNGFFAQAIVANTGANLFVGYFLLNAEYYSTELELTLAVNKAKSLRFDLPTGYASGEYTVLAAVLCNGAVTASRQTSFVLAPSFQVVRSSVSASCEAGGTGSISYAVKNTGTAEGPVKLRARLGDILDQEQAAWLAPGEEKEVTFTFAVPEDIEEKDYYGSVTLTNAQTSQETVLPFTVHLLGYKVAAGVSLDRDLYAPGETASLTLQAASLNGLSPVVYAKLLCGDYQVKTSTFSVGQSSYACRFDIPLPSQDFNSILLSYGLYFETGRSLYLNTAYIYQKHRDIYFALDRQSYNTGETAVAAIQPEKPGRLTVSANGFTQDLTLATTEQLSLNIPIDEWLQSGTYYVDYSFTAEGSTVPVQVRVPFDVNGYHVVLKDTR